MEVSGRLEILWASHVEAVQFTGVLVSDRPKFDLDLPFSAYVSSYFSFMHQPIIHAKSIGTVMITVAYLLSANLLPPINAKIE